MKLTRFYVDGGAIHVGAATAYGVVDVTALGFGDDIVSLPTDALARSVELYTALYISMHSNTAYTTAHNGFLDPATLRYAPITSPRKIICAGLNYRDHAEETGGEAPEHPILFTKYADTLAPHGAKIELPQWLRCFDYEAELVVVIGRAAYNIAEDDADDYIFGYTCGDDLSARDSQFLSNQWAAGKNFPDFAPTGPFITTADEWQPDSKYIRTYVNGDLRQNGNTSDMIFSVRANVAAASRYFALEPGDLVFTGTPAGVILGKPKGSRVWLTRGDVVRVEIEGLGALENELM
ncbi:MAG: fumarylacetoacetate hydrolase family protein [Oscillospiraceae bacterium]|jgi:2-keto-4-pentenoate hydratase/2-oxohepta-3-ene-1,7-dioic acid hydratase in catechol pathway|nr:fumarylacetoacetate hydrolase family protein [Oscillospiraceae bacterium]